MSTISLLGCSTSVALAMGPTDEEEEEVAYLIVFSFFHFLLNHLLATVCLQVCHPSVLIERHENNV